MAEICGSCVVNELGMDIGPQELVATLDLKFLDEQAGFMVVGILAIPRNCEMFLGYIFFQRNDNEQSNLSKTRNVTSNAWSPGICQPFTKRSCRGLNCNKN